MNKLQHITDSVECSFSKSREGTVRLAMRFQGTVHTLSEGEQAPAVVCMLWRCQIVQEAELWIACLPFHDDLYEIQLLQDHFGLLGILSAQF